MAATASTAHFLAVLRAAACKATICHPFLGRMGFEWWIKSVPTATSTRHWVDRSKKTSSGSLVQPVSSRSIDQLPVHSTSRRESPTPTVTTESLHADRVSTTNRLTAYCCV